MDHIPLAVSYRTNGANFRASAERLAEHLELDGDGRPTNMTAIPLYFLASHAAELFLKAALLKRGATPQFLSAYDYRHNLEELLAELVAKGVAVSEPTRTLIDGMSEQDRTHRLRYPEFSKGEGVRLSWPPLSQVFAALDELLLLTRISTQGV